MGGAARLAAVTGISIPVIVGVVIVIKIALISCCCYFRVCRKKRTETMNAVVLSRQNPYEAPKTVENNFNANPAYLGVNTETWPNETSSYPPLNNVQGNPVINPYPPAYPIQANPVINPNYPTSNPTLVNAEINPIYPVKYPIQNDIATNTTPIVIPTNPANNIYPVVQSVKDNPRGNSNYPIVDPLDKP